MKRRDFLGKAGMGLAATTAAAGAIPAAAQGLPTIRWRMVSSFPKSLDTIYGGADDIAKRVTELTEGKFTISCHPAGEIVPGLQVMDAVQNGTVECCHTLTSFFFGKNPAIAFDAGLAFGLNVRQQNAWMHYGGGLELVRQVFAQFNCISIPAGNVGAQMGGFFRKEIKSVADLKGLKMRIGGFGGTVLAKLGAVPQQIAAGEIYQALERGTIDAAEFVGPYDDEKLGLHKIAKYYYTPGWWEGSAMESVLVNLKQWESLPKLYQAVLETACAETNMKMIAKYDAKNPEALKRLVGAGVQLRQFPRDVMDAAYRTAFELYDDLAEKNAEFKRLYDSWKRFREDQAAWWRVAEATLDNYTLGRVGRPAPKGPAK
jgi:TRAP-type mannitol/chloroaromatic compound transport system substrate-binding protein